MARGVAKARFRPYNRVMDLKSAHDPAQDHSHCEGHGEHAQGLRLTSGRRAILDLLCAEGKPMGAYDMIEKLVAQGGKRLAPISAHRALDFLLDNGLAHRLSSKNTYLACGHHHGKHAAGFHDLRQVRRGERADVGAAWPGPRRAGGRGGICAARADGGSNRRCAACRGA